LVAFGSCAHIGGIPGLANLFTREEIMRRVYQETPSTVNPDKIEPNPKTEMPEGDLTIPEMYDTVRTLDQVVNVDYYVPGFPPTPAQIWKVVQVILGGTLPPKGSVIGASEKTQCDECTRKKQEKKISSFKRIATAKPDPDLCFLEQGFLCMGPVTRGGCDTRCQLSGVGCRGCYGPPPGVLDQGAKALSAITSVIEAKEEGEIQHIIDEIPDTLRSFNRFGIPASLITRKVL
jgi:F420-non-reducing hydrogenase small subunit